MWMGRRALPWVEWKVVGVVALILLSCVVSMLQALLLPSPPLVREGLAGPFEEDLAGPSGHVAGLQMVQRVAAAVAVMFWPQR